MTVVRSKREQGILNARRSAYRQACMDVCDYCKVSSYPQEVQEIHGPNSVGEYYHVVLMCDPGAEVVCAASAIWARIAFEEKMGM